MFRWTVAIISKQTPQKYRNVKRKSYHFCRNSRNPENIKNGFFELDWNNEFIEQLLDAGYSGETNEEIVNGWFRTIAIQILEEDGIDTQRDIGYINVKPIDKEKSEVS